MALVRPFAVGWRRPGLSFLESASWPFPADSKVSCRRRRCEPKDGLSFFRARVPNPVWDQGQHRTASIVRGTKVISVWVRPPLPPVVACEQPKASAGTILSQSNLLVIIPVQSTVVCMYSVPSPPSATSGRGIDRLLLHGAYGGGAVYSTRCFVHTAPRPPADVTGQPVRYHPTPRLASWNELNRIVSFAGEGRFSTTKRR